MHRRPFLALTALALPSALTTLLSGCASPEPAYYTLQTRPAAAAFPPGVKLVEMRRIGLAGYLDRPDIVRNNADYRLRLAGNERWGEPLGDLFARTLAEDLNMRLPGTSVFSATGAISATAEATLELDLQRFDVDANGQVLLVAQVAVSRGRNRGAAETQMVRISLTPAGPTTRDMVAALSTAVGQLADRIAPMLRV